jgi:uncharacterized protein (TIGR02996 family)
MSAADRAAFLRAIADNPDDDLPRLVFADWLDEHGEPERAEFIRVQCEAARLRQNDPRLVELNLREVELLANHEADWQPGPFDGLTPGPYQRGFIRDLTVTRFESFLAGMGQIAPLHPVIYLRIHRMRPTEFRRLAQMQQLSTVEVLDVSGGTISNAAVRAFIESPYLGNLRSLHLNNNPVGDVAAQAISESAKLAGLRTLALRTCRLTDTGAEALAASTSLTNLTRLDARVNPIGREGRALLRARFGGAVKV